MKANEIKRTVWDDVTILVLLYGALFYLML